MPGERLLGPSLSGRWGQLDMEVQKLGKSSSWARVMGAVCGDRVKAVPLMSPAAGQGGSGRVPAAPCPPLSPTALCSIHAAGGASQTLQILRGSLRFQETYFSPRGSVMRAGSLHPCFLVCL